MSVRQIPSFNHPAAEGKHLVINCRTARIYACDAAEEAAELAARHDEETARLLALNEGENDQ